MRSDLKFILKDKWAIDLDFNTANLVDSQRNFHMGMELQDQHSNEAEYLSSDDGNNKENDLTTEGIYATSNNNIANNISRNEE